MDAHLPWQLSHCFSVLASIVNFIAIHLTLSSVARTPWTQHPYFCERQPRRLGSASATTKASPTTILAHYSRSLIVVYVLCLTVLPRVRAQIQWPLPGYISTIAGDGQVGDGPNGIIATDAMLHFPVRMIECRLLHDVEGSLRQVWVKCAILP